MTNIQLAKIVKKEFKKYKQNDESIDECLMRLFNESRLETYESIDGNTTMLITDENVARLLSYKAYETETYSSVLLRLLESVKK